MKRKKHKDKQNWKHEEAYCCFAVTSERQRGIVSGERREQERERERERERDKQFWENNMNLYCWESENLA